MNKKLFATSVFAFALALSTSAFAGEMGKPCDCGCKKMQPCQEHQIKGKQKKNCPCPKCAKKQFKSHEAMRKEFEEALNLTAEQKAKLDKNRERSMKKLEKIACQEKKLAKKKMEILKNDREFFMETLTDEQKATLKKFKEAKKAEFEKAKCEKAKTQKGKTGCPANKPCHKKPIKK